jgi:hypothetical protein
MLTYPSPAWALVDHGEYGFGCRDFRLWLRRIGREPCCRRHAFEIAWSRRVFFGRIIAWISSWASPGLGASPFWQPVEIAMGLQKRCIVWRVVSENQGTPVMSSRRRDCAAGRYCKETWDGDFWMGTQSRFSPAVDRDTPFHRVTASCSKNTSCLVAVFCKIPPTI